MVGSTGEFERIAAFLSHFPRPRVPVGPGDDCAVLAPTREASCVTTDALVEDVHFSRASFSPEDIGHKALAVNLSDLAAMGAQPAWFLVALGVPKGFPERELAGIARGMARLARSSRVALIGGNFTRARELSITVTAAGNVPEGRALLRSGARPEDLLFVSGTLGDAAAGLLALQTGRRSSCVRRQKRPTPRLGLGLLARRFATAAIDVSDGFAQDLGHLCAASRVGAFVDVAALPLSRGVRTRAQALALALSGGEDYELLLSVPPRRAAAFVRACERAGERVSEVGWLTPGRKMELIGADGRLLPVPSGYDHFRR